MAIKSSVDSGLVTEVTSPQHSEWTFLLHPPPPRKLNISIILELCVRITKHCPQVFETLHL